MRLRVLPLVVVAVFVVVVAVVVSVRSGRGVVGVQGVPVAVSTPASVVVGGRSYVVVRGVRPVGVGGVEVNGLDYIVPGLLSDYPAGSEVVEAYGVLYIWTGSRLVALAPACIASPGGC